MNTYKTNDPYAMTLLRYRPAEDVDAWIEVWVKEGEVDDREDLVCFRADGSQISICPRREVFEYEKQLVKWRGPKPNRPNQVGTRQKIGKLRQKTIYVRQKIGVDARFEPVYRRRDANAQVLRTTEV